MSNRPLFSIVLMQADFLRRGTAFWRSLPEDCVREIIVESSEGLAGCAAGKARVRSAEGLSRGCLMGELYASAVDCAEGEYILFAGGDAFKPGLLSSYAKVLSAHPDVDFIFSGGIFFYYSKNLPVKQAFFSGGRQSQDGVRKGLTLGVVDRHFPLVRTACLREAKIRFAEKWEPIIHHDLAIQCSAAGCQLFYLKKDFHETALKNGNAGHTPTFRRLLNLRRREWLEAMRKAAPPCGAVQLANRWLPPAALLEAFEQGRKLEFLGRIESREVLLMLLYYNSFFADIKLHDPLDVCRVLGSCAYRNIMLEA